MFVPVQANGWELTCGARFGLRLYLRLLCCLQEPVLRLALNPHLYSLLTENSARGAVRFSDRLAGGLGY